MNSLNRSTAALPRGRWLLLASLLLYATLVGTYWVLRYSTLWTEADTGIMTWYVEAMLDSGALSSADQPVYPHGIGYQTLSTSLALATGLELQTLQTIVYPLLAAPWLALVAFAFYSQLLGERRATALAVFFLFLQPDLLFVTLRGSHEKLDWPLMMVALMLLCLSLRRPPRQMIVYVPLFYLTAFAMIAVHAFFASTFLVAVTVSLVLGLVITAFQRRRVISTPKLRRLSFIALSCSVLIFLFLFYLYPEGGWLLLLLNSVLEQVSVLVLGFDVQGEPYSYISASWTSPYIYWGLTLFTWFLVFLSFAEWVRRGVQFMRGAKPFEIQENLDWLLYAGFAIQVAAAIVVDFSGALGTNLQLRMFPVFTIMAVALLAQGAVRIMAMPGFRGWCRRFALGGAVLAVAWFGVTALLKATDEPLLNNSWKFFALSEERALSWCDANLKQCTVWTGIDARLLTVFRLRGIGDSDEITVQGARNLETGVSNILLTKRDQLRAARMGVAMPPILDWDLAYDNGDAYLYHRRSRTVYQK